MHEEDAMTIRPKPMVAVAMLAMFAAGVAGAHDRRHDHDGNPPGPTGGPGTNWENPPGWRGGPGASPDQRWWHHQGQRYEFRLVKGGYYFNPMYGYWHPQHGFWIQAGHCWRDNDGNPPGRPGGKGTNWENPPGWRGGPGASPDRYGRCH
jgi:hypothetical protein